jgi:hypothetical protein
MKRLQAIRAVLTSVAMVWLAMATAFVIHQIISADPLRPVVANTFDKILTTLPRGVFTIGSWSVKGSSPGGEPLWPPTGDPWILSPWVTVVFTAAMLGALACILHLVALRVLIELQRDPDATTAHKVFTAAAIPTAWLTASVLVLYLLLSTGYADQWQKMNVFAMKGSSSQNLIPVKLYLPFSASQLYQSSYWIYPDAPAAIVYNRYGAALVTLGALLLYGWLMLRCTRAARRRLADANSCPTCGYTRANPTAPCPECGHNAAPANTATHCRPRTRLAYAKATAVLLTAGLLLTGPYWLALAPRFIGPGATKAIEDFAGRSSILQTLSLALGRKPG